MNADAERLAAAAREYRALLYGAALLARDQRLEFDVLSKAGGAGARLHLFGTALWLLIESIPDEDRESLAAILRQRADALVARHGAQLDAGWLDDDAMGRFLDLNGGAT